MHLKTLEKLLDIKLTEPIQDERPMTVAESHACETPPYCMEKMKEMTILITLGRLIIIELVLQAIKGCRRGSQCCRRYIFSLDQRALPRQSETWSSARPLRHLTCHMSHLSLPLIIRTRNYFRCKPKYTAYTKAMATLGESHLARRASCRYNKG